MLGTLDRLGENVTSETEALGSVAEILDLLGEIEASDAKAGVSIELTQFGLDLGPALVVENVQCVMDRAAQAGIFIRIDMESSEYVQPTLDLFERLWQYRKSVSVVVQSYLYRSADDVARLVELGAPVRLVKGAYDEPADAAYPEMAATDANFVRLADQESGVYPAIATHDGELIEWVREHTHRVGLARDRIEFQILYGIRRGLRHSLASEGYRVRVCIPYGAHWYPYFMRRLGERPANLLFVLSDLLRA
ncbi:proline dehydrogenase family protein [Chloroflexota bacterium]